MIAQERLYLTADRSRVVRENDRAARFLLVGVGGTISAADVERYGLVDGDISQVEPEPDEVAPQNDVPQAKAVEFPPAVKRARLVKADK